MRGQAFERTIKVAADLSSRLGTDLKTSIRQVGLALQDPTNGLQLLRRAGISFDDTQKNLIKNFVETNQLGKAQNLILGELEQRFKGSATAARSTLGGALAGLKNQFGDLFEGSRESSKEAADAINRITRALEDPRLKSGLDKLIAGMANVAANAIEGAMALPEKLGIIDTNAFTRGGGPRRSSSRTASPETDAALTQLEEIKITAQKIVDANGDLMQELADSTKTGVEKAAGEYIKLKETLQFLNDQQLITSREQKERLGAALDELLPEFDLNEIRAKYISLKKETTELGEFMKGVWQGVGRSIHSTLSDAIYEWKLSWRSLLDITRRALADIASAIFLSGIKDALKSQLTKSGSGASGAASSGFLAAIGSLFGLASGGQYDGLRMVGEDGPELVGGRGRVWNQRQMAFAGMGGAKVTYAPITNISIVERDDPERTKREIFETVAAENSKQQQELIRTLSRSGVDVRG